MLGKGLKVSTPSKVAGRRPIVVPDGRAWWGFGPVARLLTGGKIAGRADLSAWAPRGRLIQGRQEPLDQGPTGSCTAHSLAGVYVTAAGATGIAVDSVPSPDLQYKLTRARERSLFYGPGQTLPELTDTGAELADAEIVASAIGLAPLGALASDGRYSDVDLATFNDEPDLARIQVAGLRAIVGPYVISAGLTGGQKSDQVAACLTAGIPVWTGFYADRAFEILMAGRVATAPIVANAPGEGGHAVFLSGFRVAASGKREFQLENSWGASWSSGGMGWVDELWLDATWELWPFVLQHVGPVWTGIAA